MLAIGMPGPFEWIIILVMLAIVSGFVLVVIRAISPPRQPREPRGFDVNHRDDDDRRG